MRKYRVPHHQPDCHPLRRQPQRQGTRLCVQTAAAVIDQWHAQRGFHRQPAAIAAYNPDLKAIGYHFVLDVDGTKSTGRALDEIGAHVAGHNANSIGICMVGTDQYSTAQWGALASLVKALLAKYPGVPVVGHRDLSPT
jgi:hypothetical protein